MSHFGVVDSLIFYTLCCNPSISELVVKIDYALFVILNHTPDFEQNLSQKNWARDIYCIYVCMFAMFACMCVCL